MVSNKKRKFNKIVQDIKKIKIQGATNVVKAALKAYSIIPTKASAKKLLASRPTEPMMAKVLDLARKTDEKEIMKHFSSAQEKINRHVFRLIKKDRRIFTHCHSTNVSKALIYSKKKGGEFQVYVTETRPLYQGRLTARELRKEGINVTMFVDSSMAIAIEKENKKDKVYADRVLIGADALLKNGIINKVGSELVARIAKEEKVPFYIVADSWKFTEKKVPIEQRSLKEIWDKAPKNIKIKNPSFEFVDKKYIKGIITEFGLMPYNHFVRTCSKN